VSGTYEALSDINISQLARPGNTSINGSMIDWGNTLTDNTNPLYGSLHNLSTDITAVSLKAGDVIQFSNTDKGVDIAYDGDGQLVFNDDSYQ